MKKTIFVTSSLALIVTIGCFLGVSKTEFAVNADSQKTIFNYSLSERQKTLKGSELLQSILLSQGNSSVISDAETKFLDNNYEFKFDSVSNTNYNVGLINDTYWVESFAAEDYVPKWLVVNGERIEFERINKQYIANVPSIENAKIVYEKTINVLSKDANKVLTEAFTVGKNEAHNVSLKQKYEENLAKYNQYLLDKSKYDNYVIEKVRYDLEKANYDRYLADLSKYNIDLENYDKYTSEFNEYLANLEKYNKYLEDIDIHNKNVEKYEESVALYNAQLKIATSQLKILDVLFKNFGSLNLSIDHFINSDTVDTVVERRDEIVLADVEGVAIDRAKEYTPLIRQLIASYKEIMGSSIEERYAWYQRQYIGLRNSLSELTRCLEYFYTSGVVRSAIEEKEKTEKYLLFVAELMYFCDLINVDSLDCYKGSYVLDENRKIGGVSGNYIDFIGNDLLDVSIDPKPLRTILSKPSELELSEPEEVVKPVEPIEVKKPVPPVEVKEPTPIENVAKPEPVVEPIDPQVSLNPELSDLSLEYEQGILKERNKVTNYVPIVVYGEVDIKPSNLKDLAILIDVRAGTTAGKAKIKEFVFFDDPSQAIVESSIPTQVGIATSNLLFAYEIFGASILDMSSEDIQNLILNQSSSLIQYSIIWNHVLDNEEHKNFESLGSSSITTGYELTIPSINPVHPDDYVEEIKVFTYKFVGYDFTDDVDNTSNRLSGLTTCDDISLYQNHAQTIQINLVFEKIPVHAVKFGEHQTMYVEDGTLIEMPDFIPTKSSTSSCCYEFKGWAKNGENEIVSFPYLVKEKVVFSPIFERTNLFVISFVVNEKIVETQTLKEGEMPIAPSNVTKESTLNKFYIFDGWDKEVTNATENMTYTAKFIECDLVENAKIFQSQSSVVVEKLDSNVANINKLLTLIKDKDELEIDTLSLKIKDASIYLNKTQLLFLISVNADQISIVKNNTKNLRDEYELVIKTTSGMLLEANSFIADITIENIEDASHARVFLENEEISSAVSSNTSITLQMQCNKKVSLKYFYKVMFDKNLTTCKFKLNDEDVSSGSMFEIEKGKTVKIDCFVNKGIDLLSVYGTQENGKRTNLNETKELVIDSDLVISADVERTIYHVDLYVDGVLFQRIEGTYGVLMNLPLNVYKSSDELNRYVFKGWDKNPEIFDDNYVLNAMFDSIQIKLNKEEEETKKGLNLAQKFSIAALTITVLVVIGGAVFIISKFNKKSL